MITTPAIAPESSVTIHRNLHDGASYDLHAAAARITCLGVRDHGGDCAMVGLDRDAVRQLIADLTLAAGLQPTPATVGPAAALAGAFRRSFELLVELDKTDPAAAGQIAASIASHLRSWRPMALVSEVSP